MLKWLGRLFLAGIALVVVLGVAGYFYLKGNDPPPIKDAPYALQAYYETEGTKFPTRYYYAEKIEIVSGNAVMDKYWTYDGERYHKHNDTKEVKPPFTVVRRLE